MAVFLQWEFFFANNCSQNVCLGVISLCRFCILRDRPNTPNHAKIFSYMYTQHLRSIKSECVVRVVAMSLTEYVSELPIYLKDFLSFGAGMTYTTSVPVHIGVLFFLDEQFISLTMCVTQSRF